MIALLDRFIRAQSAEEIARQETVLGQIEGLRTALTLFAYAVAAIYLPIVLCAGLAVIDLAAEFLGARALIGLDPARQPARYLAAHLAVLVSEVAYVAPGAVLWQMDEPFARALAIGMLAITLMQLLSVRSIHLPFALTGWATVLAMALAANTILWLDEGHPLRFLLSTAVALAAGLFSYRVILTNHSIHDSIAQERMAAQAADRAKSLFLAQMSHELRTPLNAIIGMGAIELAQARDPDTRARMSTLVQSARGLGIILDDILDLAAAREGRLQVRPADLDLGAEIQSIVALFRPLAEAKGLDIDLDRDPGLPALARFDGNRLRQCMSNVLSNALKQTETGSVSIRVQAVAGLAAVTIADTGPGIAPDLAPQLFEPFHQGPGARGGTGLGLAISRQIARAMGGDLVLMPSPARAGARFRLTFRLEPPSPGAQGARQAGAAPEVFDFGGARVLVVDDIATNRLVAASMLKLYNTRTIEAANAEEALALIAAEPVQAVLLDMNMPGVDGLECFRRICRDAARRGTERPPVVAMTADATEAHRNAYLGAGLDGYVAKPLEAEALARALAQALLPAAAAAGSAG